MKQEMKNPEHNEREAWAGDVMRSLDGMQRATAPEGLYGKLMQRIHQAPALARPYVWLAAAGFALLLILNAWAWQGRGAAAAKPQASLAEQFQLITPSTVDYQ